MAGVILKREEMRGCHYIVFSSPVVGTGHTAHVEPSAVTECSWEIFSNRQNGVMEGIPHREYQQIECTSLQQVWYMAEGSSNECQLLMALKWAYQVVWSSHPVSPCSNPLQTDRISTDERNGEGREGEKRWDKRREGRRGDEMRRG